MRTLTSITRSDGGMVNMSRLSRQSKIALMNAKASMAIEGMHLTVQEEKLLMDRASGKLKNSDFLARAREIAKNV